MSDYRDLTIETLVLSEAELLDRVGSLEVDIVTLRLLTCEALAMLHALMRTSDRQRAELTRLIDEARELRAALMRVDGIHGEEVAA